MDIPPFKKRFVLLAALDCYAKALGRAKKSCEDVSAKTDDLDEKTIIVEHLKAEYQEMQGQLTLEGTPMSQGEAATAEHFRDEDGTDLQVIALDAWMRGVAGAYVPADVIGSWPLQQRKIAAAWLRAVEINVGEAIQLAADQPMPDTDEGREAVRSEIIQREQQQARVTAPDFIQLEWFNKPTLLEDLPWTEEEVAHWLEHGQWGVKAYVPEGGSPAADEWEIVKVDADTGAVLEALPKVSVGLANAQEAAARQNHAAHIAKAQADAGGAVTDTLDVEAEALAGAAELDEALHPV